MIPRKQVETDREDRESFYPEKGFGLYKSEFIAIHQHGVALLRDRFLQTPTCAVPGNRVSLSYGEKIYLGQVRKVISKGDRFDVEVELVR